MILRRALPDIYVSGLSHIEVIGGGNVRYCLYVNRVVQRSKVLMSPAAHIVMPLESMGDAIAKSMAIAARRNSDRRYLLDVH